MNYEKVIFLGGVSFSFSYSIFQPELIQTIVYAIIGSLVSYIMSKLFVMWEKRQNNRK